VAAARNTCVADMEIRSVRICKLKNSDAHRIAVAWGISVHQDSIKPRKLVTRNQKAETRNQKAETKGERGAGD
jgi:hypothetical protein